MLRAVEQLRLATTGTCFLLAGDDDGSAGADVRSIALPRRSRVLYSLEHRHAAEQEVLLLLAMRIVAELLFRADADDVASLGDPVILSARGHLVAGLLQLRTVRMCGADVRNGLTFTPCRCKAAGARAPCRGAGSACPRWPAQSTRGC